MTAPIKLGCYLCSDFSCPRCQAQIAMVQGLRASTAAKSGVLTEKEKEHTATVASQVDAGISPFRHDEPEKDQKGYYHKDRQKEPTDAEIELKASYWRSGAGTRRLPTYRVGNYPNSPVKDFAPDPELDQPPIPADKVRCTFCGKDVYPHEATLASVFKGIKVKRHIIDKASRSFWTEKRAITEKDIACQDCSTQIKPTVGRDGSIKAQNTIFTRTEDQR